MIKVSLGHGHGHGHRTFTIAPICLLSISLLKGSNARTCTDNLALEQLDMSF